MCEPCTTATACTSNGRRRQKPTQSEELTAIGRAMADTAGVFAAAVNLWSWSDEPAKYESQEAYERGVAVRRAAQMCEFITDLLSDHFPWRPDQCDAGQPSTDGNRLRHVGEQMDRLDASRGYHTGLLDDKEREYSREEIYPHVLRDRSTRNPAACPLCGGWRVYNLICHEETEDKGWMCSTCEGDVRKAKKVLKDRRVPDRQKPCKPKKAVSSTKGQTPASPAGGFALPFFGTIDLRTPEERAADDAAGIDPPELHLPEPTKPKRKPVVVPPLHNRISDLAD